MGKNITDCFKLNSTIDISDVENGELDEVDTNGESITKITALKDGAKLECFELIETDNVSNRYLDDKVPTTITGNNRIVFTKDHKIYCGEFIEDSE